MRLIVMALMFLALGCGSKGDLALPDVPTDDTEQDDTGDGADNDDPGGDDTGEPSGDDPDGDDTGEPSGDDPDGDDTGEPSGDDTGDGEVVPVDEDGDGVSIEAGDCDDTRDDVYPDAPELCDEADNNCDGVVDEGVTSMFYADSDSDGFGDSLIMEESCTAPDSFVADATDCDDTRDDVYPDAPELCDEADNNCDGVADEGVTSMFYADSDSDGYGDAGSTVEACAAPDAFVADATDCDDSSSVVYPGATEICDEQDNDCDSMVDEGVESTWYLDFDADGFGGSAYTWSSCEAPLGYVASSDDCDDTSMSSYPGAIEVCDEEDNNCDGVVDEGLTTTYFRDADSDGYGGVSGGTIEACDLPTGYSLTSDDCADTSPFIHPDAAEVCDDMDNDCDGDIDDADSSVSGGSTWYMDADGDGFAGSSVSMVSCVMPGGWMDTALDCYDSDDSIYPGAAEICDDMDNDCDGDVDDADSDVTGVSVWFSDIDADGYGDPDSSISSCSPGLGYVADGSDCDDSNDSAYPGAEEVCDEVDNDCNDIIDDDASDGFLVYVDSDGDGHGDPAAGSSIACELTIGTSDLADDCDDSDGFRSPSEAEIECNGIDEDCDGEDFCLSTCGNGIVDVGEEIEMDSDVYSFISVDSDTCRWDFSSVQQLYCNGSCSWAGGSSCDDADADILCKLLTDNPSSTAISWTATLALDEPGFSCPGYGGVIPTDRGYSGAVHYQDTSIRANHGAGSVVAYPVCTDP
jgi:predicted small lipoprotein YifL